MSVTSFVLHIYIQIMQILKEILIKDQYNNKSQQKNITDIDKDINI